MLLLCFLLILFLPMDGDNIDLGNNRYYIAHAGGAISGKEYTNSREALENSLNEGYKYIEIDLRETSDSAIVCCHEWDEFYRMTGLKTDDADKGITLQKFKQCKIYGKYSTLVADDLVKKLNERTDFVLVTDKLSDVKKLNRVFPYVQRHRIMVEAFRSQDYADLKDAGYIPMMSVATLKDLLVFEIGVLLKTGNVIERVTMPISNEYVYRLFKRIFGVKIAVYTSNDENFFKRYLGKEIDMVYTDSCSLIKK